MVTVVAIGAALLIMASGWTSLTTAEARIIVSAVGVLLLAALYLFGSLTVTVDTERVQLWFGPGLIRKRFDLSRILDAKAVRNPWWFGWGIRVIPDGWLYNVSGLDAVELLMGDGRKVRIGTDEPDALLAAIAEARSSR
jgi:hypothetical protein